MYLRTDQHLYFFYEVYDPAKDKSPEPSPTAKEKAPPVKNPIHLLTSIVFFNGKVKAFETPLIEARQLNAPERKAAVFQFDVPLAQLKPGLYTCQVNVIDDAGGNFLFPRASHSGAGKSHATASNVSRIIKPWPIKTRDWRVLQG